MANAPAEEGRTREVGRQTQASATVVLEQRNFELFLRGLTGELGGGDSIFFSRHTTVFVGLFSAAKPARGKRDYPHTIDTLALVRDAHEKGFAA